MAQQRLALRYCETYSHADKCRVMAPTAYDESTWKKFSHATIRGFTQATNTTQEKPNTRSPTAVTRLPRTSTPTDQRLVTPRYQTAGHTAGPDRILVQSGIEVDTSVAQPTVNSASKPRFAHGRPNSATLYVPREQSKQLRNGQRNVPSQPLATVQTKAGEMVTKAVETGRAEVKAECTCWKTGLHECTCIHLTATAPTSLTDTAPSNRAAVSRILSILRSLPPEATRSTLAAMTPADRAATLAAMSPEEKAAAVEGMSPESRASALAAMSPEDRLQTLELMRPVLRVASLADMALAARATALAAMTPQHRAAAINVMSPNFKAHLHQHQTTASEADCSPKSAIVTMDATIR